MRLNRRSLIGTAFAFGAGLSVPMVQAQTKPRVVIIGGGPGGATVARAIAGHVDVVLVEANPVYTTCFMSNHYLAGMRDLESLQFGYQGLERAGVRVVHALANAIDRSARRVILADGTSLAYDHLVLSPGIEFRNDALAGWTVADETAMPHAFKAGAQTVLLKQQLEAMPLGGTFAMVAPPNPYRCPPGPYERVSMIAHWFTQHNPNAKILILDPKDGFSKQTLFEDGWATYYPGMIDRIGPDFGGADVELRPASMEVVVDGEVVGVDVCNVIPAQKAGAIAELAGLVDETGWAVVQPENLRSVADPFITVLGDSCEPGEMPKSAFSAQSQGHVAAAAILAELVSATPVPAEYANTCWSLIAPDDCVKVSSRYTVGPQGTQSIDNFVSAREESAEIRLATFAESQAWYAQITAEMFG